MSAEFRQIANRRESGKSERLVRAAVSAFCSLPRPTRREVQQLGQLTLPLFERIGTDCKRFAAASLSDSRYAPRDLVLRLCGDSVDICAPLLIRSPVLTDADLVRIIGNEGAAHARVILRRTGLHPAIAALSARLAGARESHGTAVTEPGAGIVAAGSVDQDDLASYGSEGLEKVREQLRHIMAGSTTDDLPASPVLPERSHDRKERDYRRLKANVLSGNAAFFQAALADALGMDCATAQAIVGSRSYDDLIGSLRQIGLSEEEAFLLVCAACPSRFSRAEDIRSFTERYRALQPWPAGQPSHGSTVAAVETHADLTSDGRVVQLARK